MNNLKCLKQGFNKYVCKHTNKEIKLNDCKNCPYKEYKKQINKSLQNRCRPLLTTAELKKKSKKLAKLERDRFSLFTDDLDHCIICGKGKEHFHEIYPGAFRLRSIKEHMVLPLCSFHHRLIHNDVKLSLYWKQLGQKIFEKHHLRDEFIKAFGRSYL